MAYQKHSEAGVASFVISIIVIAIALFPLFLDNNFSRVIKDDALEGKSVGLFLAMLLSLVLGITGLFQKDRQKIFAIIGTVISASIVSCIALLFSIFMSFTAA